MHEQDIAQIHIIKDFLSPEEVKFYIDYIDNNPQVFKDSTIHGELRKILMFGKDSFHKDKSPVTLDIIGDIEDKLRTELFPKVETTIKETYGNRRNLMVNSFFMGLQFAGAKVDHHIDTDGGVNMQFKYSAIIYLNEMKSGGELTFPDLGYTYTPKAGEMVVFPSKPLQFAHAVEEIHETRYTLPIWVTEYEFFKL
tara:strand:- start:6765 stop:7352 length:588 start_codon:yes stop_codon:yes gene_type:complete